MEDLRGPDVAAQREGTPSLKTYARTCIQTCVGVFCLKYMSLYLHIRIIVVLRGDKIQKAKIKKLCCILIHTLLLCNLRQ